MTSVQGVHLGFEVGSGATVEIPLLNTVVCGMTQSAGKTTTLEALVARSSATALAFVTKRGESAFTSGWRVQPYFRDRADWQFVSSIIDATLQEKNKFLRPWIMRICRTTRTLADVQREVRKALEKAKGINEGVYTQLDAYLDLIVPEIARARLAPTLDLRPGLNVMDVGSFATPMQMLFVQSALDWVNEHETKTVVVIPEAWEFIPEGKGSPVKAAAITLVRKGSGIGNHIFVDSQDTAGVDKVILRGCTVWLLGVQREANEIKRNLANIPTSIKKPNAADVATLGKGQFYACWGTHATKTYVQPAWMEHAEAEAIAKGTAAMPSARWVPPRMPAKPEPVEDTVANAEAYALRDENARLQELNADLLRRIQRLEGELHDRTEKLGEVTVQKERTYGVAPETGVTGPRIAWSVGPRAAAASSNGAPTQRRGTFTIAGMGPSEIDALYDEFRARMVTEDPLPFLQVQALRPELRVEIRRETIRVDGKTTRGRIARLMAEGFWSKSRTSAEVLAELEKTGAKPSNIELGNELKALVEMGFFTRENKWYSLVVGMTANVVEV